MTAASVGWSIGSQVEDQTLGCFWYNWGGRAGGQHIWGVGEVGEGVDRVASWDIQLRWSDTAGSRKHGAAGYAHCAIVLQWQRRDSLRSSRGAGGGCTCCVESRNSRRRNILREQADR